MRLQNPFAALCTTGLDSQVLHVLCGTERLLSAADITGLLPEGGTRQGVQKSLGRLLDQGLVAEVRVGRSRAFQLNRLHLLADAALSIAAARRTLIDRIAAEADAWDTRPLCVTLFGSAARGEMSVHSDIDLLFILPDTTPTPPIPELAADVTAWTGNDCRPLVYRAFEVTPARIFDEVLAEGIHITGDRNWLRRQLRASGLGSGA